jgi:DNA-binding GntR family transcriptional regulator
VEPQLFDRAVPRTLRTEVVGMIRNAIVTGKLRPGERLKESVIADQMSVSRSPVREAFRQLEQEDLITSIPNQGSFVRAFNENDVKEIFTLRAALEDLACEIAVREGKLQPADLERLEAYIEQQKEAVKARDFDRLTKLDMDFHEFVCKKSGFKRLLKMWRSLRAQIQVLFYQRFLTFDWVPETVDPDHSAILEALRDGNVEQFSQINRDINARVAEECIQMLRSIANGNGNGQDP